MSILHTINSDLLASTILGLMSPDRQDNLDALETIDDAGLPATKTVLVLEKAVKLTISTLKILQGIQSRDPNALASRAAAHYRKSFL